MFIYQNRLNRIIKEKSNIFFKEICSGVYKVEKDRIYNETDKAVDSIAVVNFLNNYQKITVERIDGNVISNTAFEFPYSIV